MSTRFTGVAAALVALLLGMIPAGHGHRCLWMKIQMPASHECCRGDSRDRQTEVGSPCCETTATRVVAAQTAMPRPLDELISDQTIGAIELATVVTPSQKIIHRGNAALFRPPGDRLHQLSSVLRI